MTATREVTKGKKQKNQRDSAAREGGDARGPQWLKRTPRIAQRTAMLMTRIEPDDLPGPTIREQIEGRSAGADDGGIRPKGYLGRPPKPAYETEDRAEAKRRVGRRDTALARGRPAESTRSRRAAVRGRARDRGGGGKGGERREGRKQRDAREGRPPGMAGDRQGAPPRTAKETSTEGNRDLMTCAVLTCVHAGRRVLQGRKHCGKGWGADQKKTTSIPEGEQHRASRRRGNGQEQVVQKRGHGWRTKKNRR